MSLGVTEGSGVYDFMSKNATPITGFGDKAAISADVMAIVKGGKSVLISIVNPTPAMKPDQMLKDAATKVLARM